MNQTKNDSSLYNYGIRINKSSVYIIVSLIIIVIIHLSVVENSFGTISLDVIVPIMNLISIIQLILLSYVIRRQSGAFNFMNAWILLAFLFYFGQYYCYPFVFDSRWSLFAGVRDSIIIVQCFFYSLECISIISFFYSISYNKYRKTQWITNYSPNRVKELNLVTRYFALLIISVCVIPALAFKAYAVYLGVHYDYATMKVMTGRGMHGWIKIVSYFVGWLMPACYMLIISTNKRIEQRMATALMLIYVALVLGSGSRYEALEVICAYILIVRFYYKKSVKKMIPIISITVILTLVVFSISRLERVAGGSYKSLGLGSVLYVFLGDSAPAASINYAVMEYEQRFHDYMYGESYFNGVVSALISPIRHALFPDIFLDIGDKFSNYLGVYTTSLGSSLIAEAFYNFGWYSLITVMPITGFLFGILVSAHNKYYESNIPSYRLSMYIYLCTMMVFAIRSDMATIIRTYIVYAIFPIIVIRIIVALNRKKVTQV